MKDGKYQIVSSTWQIMHFWDLFNALKPDADIFLITNSWRDWRKPEFLAARPLPENVTFVPYYEEGKYDFAILDIDQQVLNPDLGKSKTFMDLNMLITDIPKVIINHGSPVYPEFLATVGMTFEEAEVECRRQVKELIGDIPMITNSYTAASEKEWGWGYPIIHGLSPDEWLDLEKEPRIFTALSPAGFDEYYNRAVMGKVAADLEKFYGYTLWWAKMNVNTQDRPEKYKEFLGSSLIYIDTSFRTPMNRARTEAMLSGCCIVQVEGCHDQERFLKNGENCILVPNNPNRIVEILIDLLENRYEECVRIGQEGKKTAIEKFGRERYRQDWMKFIHEVLKL